MYLSLYFPVNIWLWRSRSMERWSERSRERYGGVRQNLEESTILGDKHASADYLAISTWLCFTGILTNELIERQYIFLLSSWQAQPRYKMFFVLLLQEEKRATYLLVFPSQAEAGATYPPVFFVDSGKMFLLFFRDKFRRKLFLWQAETYIHTYTETKESASRSIRCREVQKCRKLLAPFFNLCRSIRCREG